MEVEVRRIYQQLTDRARLLGITRKSMTAARGWLTASWDLYDAGFGNFRDVMDALVQFYSKKVGYLKVVHEHNLLIVELSRAIGHDITTPVPAASPAAAEAD
jgi:outer membrane protein TolC